MPIESFQWTDHALLRLDQRQLCREDVEQAIREHHDERRVNDGQADWLVSGTTHLGIRFEARALCPPGGSRRRLQGAVTSDEHVRVLRQRR